MEFQNLHRKAGKKKYLEFVLPELQATMLELGNVLVLNALLGLPISYGYHQESTYGEDLH